MAININFYLKKDPRDKTERKIYMQATYHCLKFAFYFRQRINPQLWDFATQRVKVNDDTIASGIVNINILIDKIEEECRRSYYTLVVHSTPDRGTMKFRLKTIVDELNGVKKVKKLNRTLKWNRANSADLGTHYVRKVAKKRGFTDADLAEHPEILLTIRELLKNKRLCKSLTSNS